MKMKRFLWCMLSVLMASVVSVSLSSCGEEDEVHVSQNSVSFTESGGTQSVTVTSNTDWSVAGTTTWCTVAPASGSEEGIITITATANSESSTRSATLVVIAGKASQTITVTQEAKPVILDNKVTVKNSSTYTLPRFRFVFVNSRMEPLADLEKGTLYPGGSLSADIPTAATEYYMATLINGTWFFSPNYNVKYKSLNLSTSEVDGWQANSSSSMYPENR